MSITFSGPYFIWNQTATSSGGLALPCKLSTPYYLHSAMTTVGPTKSFQHLAHDAPVYSFSVADPAASSSGGVIYTSMPNETLSSAGQFTISVYAYAGIAFLVATFLFAIGYALFRIRQDRGKRNYDLDNPFYDPNENTRYVYLIKISTDHWLIPPSSRFLERRA